MESKTTHHVQVSFDTPPPIQELFSLAGKAAIVTGDKGGLGLAISIVLTEPGADIASTQTPNDPRLTLLADALKEIGQELGRKVTRL